MIMTAEAKVYSIADNKNTDTADIAGVSGAKLKSYIERIERLEEEKTGIATDIKEIYAEAKSNGFDGKAMRKLVSLRKMDSQERVEQEEILEIYKAAVGL
jgi:uncharacterized protein (UPF0335 family)